MNGTRFDGIVRALVAGATTRREIARGIAGAAMALGLAHSSVADLAAKKKNGGKRRKLRKRKKKNKKINRQEQPQPIINRFGCADVGQPCLGDNTICCSGICDPATSTCVPHNTGICTPDLDSCAVGTEVSCNASNPSCICLRTTGQAGFCADLTAPNDGSDLCRVCARDTDCEAEFGLGAACLALGGICSALCAATGGTICAPPCA